MLRRSYTKIECSRKGTYVSRGGIWYPGYSSPQNMWKFIGRRKSIDAHTIKHNIGMANIPLVFRATCDFDSLFATMSKPNSVQIPPPETPTRVTNVDEITKKKRTRSTKLPLAGKVIAVSTLTQGDTSADTSGTVIALCKSAGAQYTAQVHKKVYCLVASSSAVKGATQRVRKAWKRRIPVVTIDWVKQCIQTGKLLDMDDFRMEEKQKSTDASSPVVPNSLETVVHEERTVELGCCCVCHESDNAKDCEWCTDCVVNR